MKISIEKASAIGDVVRAARKAQGIRRDDAAGSIGVSENFLAKSSAAANQCSGEVVSGSWRAWAST